MTDKVDADSFPDYFSVILTDRESELARCRADYIETHISCFEYLLNYIQYCAEDEIKLTLTFQIIVKTLKKRGALLDPEFIKNQIPYLMSFITSNPDFLVNHKVLLSYCAEAIAYSYRFLFEITVPSPPPFTEIFELYNDSNISFKIIALVVMKYVVDVMNNTELSHTLESTQRDNAIIFQKLYLYKEECNYFQTASEIILQSNDALVDYALDLLNSCFQLYSNKVDYRGKRGPVDLDTYYFNPPPEIIQFYQNPSNSLPKSLIELFDQSTPGGTRERQSMECLMYLASANENIWLTQQSTRISFLIFTANGITQLINNQRCQKHKDSLFVTSRLVFKLAHMRLPIASFFQEGQQIAVDFFVAVRELTIFSFNEYLMDESSNYLIRFWSQIVASRFKPNLVPQEFLQLFPQIFEAYIEALINQDDEKIITDFEETNMELIIESSKFLWEIASISPQSCATNISNALSSLTEALLSKSIDLSFMSILCKIIILILIISSQFQNRISPTIYHDDEIVEKNIILITSIYNYINATNDAMAGYFQAAAEIDKESEGKTKSLDMFIKAEKALKLFTSSISRDYFVESSNSATERGIPSNTVEKVLFSLPMCESMNITQRKQFVFDMLLNRFLQDIKTLDEPYLLSDLLKFIYNSILKGLKPIKILSQNNILLQKLVQRQFFLEFSHSQNTGKMYKVLNQIYVRAIQTVEQFEAFLPYFDQRFQQLQESSYQDAEAVYILYSELHGALKGNGNVHLFYFIFHWFLNHVDDTINCITNHGKNEVVIESICKAWRTLCSNKGNIKLILPKYSAEGIKLFQYSLRVIEALMNTGLTDMDNIKKYIINIIDPSISSENIYVNFGIMEYFKDHSFDNMAEMFFTVISDWEINLEDKLIIPINSIIQSLIQVKPSLILEEIKLNFITQFLYQAIYKYDLSSNVSSEITFNSSKKYNVFETLKSLMELFISENTESNISVFRPHFVKIINILIGSHIDGISDKLAAPIYYMIVYDGEYVEHVFDLICSLYDQNNKKEVNEIFQETFSIDLTAPKRNGITQLRTNITNIFWKSIMKYSTNIDDIEEFSQLKPE